LQAAAKQRELNRFPLVDNKAFFMDMMQ